MGELVSQVLEAQGRLHILLQGMHINARLQPLHTPGTASCSGTCKLRFCVAYHLVIHLIIDPAAVHQSLPCCGSLFSTSLII